MGRGSLQSPSFHVGFSCTFIFHILPFTLFTNINIKIQNLDSCIVKVIGAMWYLLAIERQGLCWVEICDTEPECMHRYFDCRNVNFQPRETWFSNSNVSVTCADADNFQYGLVEDSVRYSIASANFFKKYSYCLWWGLRGLG